MRHTILSTMSSAVIINYMMLSEEAQNRKNKKKITRTTTYRCPNSWAATMIPEKPPVSSTMATLLTYK